MQAQAIQKNIGHSPRKLRLVADMVRKMTPYQAVMRLQFVNRAAALDLAKAIKTALANAGNVDGLVFEKIEINEGLKFKRYKVGTAGRGRGRPMQKRLSHIKVVLTDEVKPLSKKEMKKVNQSTKRKEAKTESKVKAEVVAEKVDIAEDKDKGDNK